MSDEIPTSETRFTLLYRPKGFGLLGDVNIFSSTLLSLGYRAPAVIPANRNFSKLLRVFLSFFRWFGLLEFWQRVGKRFAFRRKKSIILHLEDIDSIGLYRKGIHVLVPNQEWFDVAALDLLHHIDEVWCKTRIAQNIFEELGCTTRYIGFRSVADLSQQSSMSSEYVFSRVGNSGTRGVVTLVEAWKRNPQWVTLKIVVHPSKRVWPKPKNVEYLDIFSDNRKYLKLASNSLFHVYLTECEGFGHSIVEALGYGALVITTDAPPMNELVNVNCGILVGSSYCGQKRLSPRFAADEETVIEKVNYALSLPKEEIKRLSQNGKLRYDELFREFPLRLETAIQRLRKRD